LKESLTGIIHRVFYLLEHVIIRNDIGSLFENRILL
jgi:hypothetical protein